MTPKLIFSMMCLFVALFKSGSALAVMNGRVADLPTSGHTIFIQVEGAVRRCTAVVVGPNLIFTAGHCFEGVSKSRVRVRISNLLDGFEYKSIYASWRGLSSPIVENMSQVPKDFAYLKTSDSLLQLLNLKSEDLPLLPLTLELQDEVLASAQSKARALGYGIFDSAEHEGQKRELSLQITSDSQLSLFRAKSLEPNAGICPGDSGGGLFVSHKGRPYLMGILSGKTPEYACEHENSRGFYLKVQPVLCWVQNTAQVNLGLGESCVAIKK